MLVDKIEEGAEAGDGTGAGAGVGERESQVGVTIRTGTRTVVGGGADRETGAMS